MYKLNSKIPAVAISVIQSLISYLNCQIFTHPCYPPNPERSATKSANILTQFHEQGPLNYANNVTAPGKALALATRLFYLAPSHPSRLSHTRHKRIFSEYIARVSPSTQYSFTLSLDTIQSAAFDAKKATETRSIKYDKGVCD